MGIVRVGRQSTPANASSKVWIQVNIRVRRARLVRTISYNDSLVMPQNERKTPSVSARPENLDDVPCPFCGLLCDDLKVSLQADQLSADAHGCPVSARGYRFANQALAVQPRAAGCNVAQADAVKAASRLLSSAKRPLFVCQGTDVAAARALMSLADVCGATIDHSHSSAMMRNIAVLQDRGWMTATLTEVRNRADLIVVAGVQTFGIFPRLVERIFHPGHSLFLEQGRPRRLILVGPWEVGALPDDVRGMDPIIYRCSMEAMGDVFAGVRALLAGRPLQTSAIGGLPLESLRKLAAELQSATYPTLTWSAAEFESPHADLAVQQLVECVRELNVKGRASALPLGGNAADMTLNQVCTWQSGTPIRTSFARGMPVYDPLHGDHQRQLADGEADVLLWYSALDPEALPPETRAKLIVLGHAGMKFTHEPDIFVPIGVPGVDHAGLFYRMDSVVSIPLRALRSARNPAGASLVSDLTAAIAQPTQ